MVTLDAILEEIVGEYTTGQGDTSEGIALQKDGSYLTDYTAAMRDINKITQWLLPF